MSKYNDFARLVAEYGTEDTTEVSDIRWHKLANGAWGIQGHGLVEGQQVEVTKRSGQTSTVTVGTIQSDRDGVQTAAVAGQQHTSRRIYRQADGATVEHTVLGNVRTYDE